MTRYGSYEEIIRMFFKESKKNLRCVLKPILLEVYIPFIIQGDPQNNGGGNEIGDKKQYVSYCLDREKVIEKKLQSSYY